MPEGDVRKDLLRGYKMNASAKKTVQARRRQYGSPVAEFRRVAALWTAILGTPVEPRQVGLCMIALKLAREVYRHKQDNLTDIAGYSDCLQHLYQKGKNDER